MRKFLATIAILGMITGLSASTVIAGENDKGFISVNTSSETEIAPDTAELSFTVKTTDTKSLQKATASNKEISDKVYNELKSMINTTAGDYIKTSNFNAQPVYVYNNSKRTLEKYEVTNRVTVHTKSIDKIGKMIDNAIALGATNVDSLNFSISNYDSQCDELLGKAAKKAYNRANILAKAVNTTLNGVNNISTSCSSGGSNSNPRLYMAKNMLAAASADSVEESASGMAISNGVIKIYANINASFFVK